MKVASDGGVLHHPNKKSYLQSLDGQSPNAGTPEKSLPRDRVDLTEGASGSANSKDQISDVADKLGDGARLEAKKTLDSLPLADMSKDALKLIARQRGREVLVDQMRAPGDIPQLGGFEADFEKSGMHSIFIRGFNWFGLSSDGGMENMSQALPGAEYYSWRDHDLIVEKIRELPTETPVVLVGHSLGGDTAVKIARELNQLENGYRPVDLLVTLDSVGFDNNIIPSNVKKNMNFIAEHGGLLSDGPNMARDEGRTIVKNQLRPEKHTRIDESEEIQKEVFDELKTIVEQRVREIDELKKIGDIPYGEQLVPE